MTARRQRRQTRCRRIAHGTDPWQHNARVRVEKLMRLDMRTAHPTPPEFRSTCDELALGLPFYNRDARRICRAEYLDLFEDAGYRQISLDHHGGTVISTVWLGIDHAFGMSPHPVIFETMVFGGDEDGFCQRYTSEDAARCGHIEVMEALLEGSHP